MAGNVDIKRRMRSINSTMQITKAMKLVSAAKLKRSKDMVDKTKSYFKSLENIIESAAAGMKDEGYKYVNPNAEEKRALYIVVTADRGMCGGYNANMVKEVIRHINEKKHEKAAVILIGTKGKEMFKRAGIELIKIHEKITESPDYSIAKNISIEARKSFDQGLYDKVYVGYTYFKSAIQQKPTVAQLLPLKITSSVDNKKFFALDFDPNVADVMEYALRKYISNKVFEAMIQSAASQQGARMTAMDSATENADEMLATLNLTFNRARQAAITQEISEIVGGADAIK